MLNVTLDGRYFFIARSERMQMSRPRAPASVVDVASFADITLAAIASEGTPSEGTPVTGRTSTFYGINRLWRPAKAAL